jgi:hypothetical protein
MSIDPFAEEILTLSQAAKRLPRLRDDRPVAPSTLWRWATAGLRGIRLETIRVGGATCTSREALGRFLDALNGRPAQIDSHSQARHDESVEAELAARGI